MPSFPMCSDPAQVQQIFPTPSLLLDTLNEPYWKNKTEVRLAKCLTQ